MHTSKMFPFSLHIFIKSFSKILLKSSTMPFYSGWYSVLFWWYIWNSSGITTIVSFKKCEPLSLIKILRQQNRDKMYWNMNFIVIATLQSFMGYTSVHLVKYSVSVMMYRAPIFFVGGLISPTKSMAHLSNSCNDNFGFISNSSLRDSLLVLW